MSNLKKNLINFDIIYNFIIVFIWCITKNIVQESLVIGNLSSIFFLLFFFVLRDIVLKKTKTIKNNHKANFINRNLVLNFYLTMLNLNIKYIYIYNKNILLKKKVLKLKLSLLILKLKSFNKTIKYCYTRIFFFNILNSNKRIGFNEN